MKYYCEEKETVLQELSSSENGLSSGEAAERIFDPFSRGDAARPTDGGSGLGLSIAQSIIRMHGWELTLSTDIPAYTKGFVIRIPW